MGRNAFTILAIALLFPACIVTPDDDDDSQGSETSAASADEGDDGEAGEDGNDEESSSEGGDEAEGGSLNADCTDLCDRTPVASDDEASCVSATLEDIGNYGFSDYNSCTELEAAFGLGLATPAMCVACYIDAGVVAEDCGVADATCF